VPLLSLASFTAASRHPHQTQTHVKAGQLTSGLHLDSDWIEAGIPAAGTTPSTAVAPTNATTGALTITAPSSGHLWGYVKRLRNPLVAGNTINSGFMIVDRLSHTGGLSGTVTTAQTVSTAALTRYTSGVGVWAAYEVYTAVGATATTITASYTNTVPTSGRTSLAVAFGGASRDGVRTVAPLSLESGDLGVTAVSTATLLATTGTAGNWGITLYYTLGLYPHYTALPFAHRGDGPEYGVAFFPVQPNACLQVLEWGTGPSNTFPTLEIGFVEVPD
jgi:hypothetical protein